MLSSSDDEEEPVQAGPGAAPARKRQPPLDFQDSAPGSEQDAPLPWSTADPLPASSGRRSEADASSQQPPLQSGSRANPGPTRFHPDTQASQTGGSQPGPNSHQQHARPQPVAGRQVQQQQQQGHDRPAPAASVPSMQRGDSRPPTQTAAAAAAAPRPSVQHSAPAALPARPVLPPQGATSGALQTFATAVSARSGALTEVCALSCIPPSSGST